MSAKEILQIMDEILHYTIFTLNQTPITLLSIILFLLIIFGFIIFSRVIKNRILIKVLSKFQLDEGLQFSMTRIIHYIIVLTGIVVAFQFIGINLTGLAVVLGFLSVGIGFGLQNVTSNFISGLIILFERPIKVGDRITVGETEGDVENIHIRSTTIRSLNNISIIVPNSVYILAGN
jgi:small-conductance mechanosensitive channel